MLAGLDPFEVGAGFRLSQLTSLDRRAQLRADVPHADVPDHYVEFGRSGGRAQPRRLRFGNPPGLDQLAEALDQVLASRRSHLTAKVCVQDAEFIETMCRCQLTMSLTYLRSQAGQNDPDEPANRGFGRQAAGRGDGVQAVTCQLVRRDIGPHLADLRGLDQQVPDEGAELAVRPGKVLTTMRQGGKFGDLVLVVHDGIELKHGFEPPAGVTGLAPELRKLLKVSCDLPFVPGEQDRLDVWEVLVQRRPPDASLPGDPRHCHRQHPVLGREGRRGVEDGVTHLAAVSLDRLAPQLRHQLSVHRDGYQTVCRNRRHNVGKLSIQLGSSVGSSSAGWSSGAETARVAGAADTIAVQQLASRLWPNGPHPGAVGWEAASDQLPAQTVLADDDGVVLGWAGLTAGELVVHADPATAAAARGWLAGPLRRPGIGTARQPSG